MATKPEAPITPIPSSTIINFAGEISYVKTILESIKEDINELKGLTHPKLCLHGENHGHDSHTTKEKVNNLSKMFYVMITIFVAVLGSAIGYVVKSTEANASMSAHINTIQVDVDEHTRLLSKIINDKQTNNAHPVTSELNVQSANVIDMPMVEMEPFAKIKRYRNTVKKSSRSKMIMSDGGV